MAAGVWTAMDAPVRNLFEAIETADPGSRFLPAGPGCLNPRHFACREHCSALKSRPFGL